jgi:isopropylmalate/homocitrate/citramalate synthase
MNEQIKIYPELFEYYPSNGIIEIYNCVNRTCSDFESLLQICRFFAIQGKHCIILPKSLHRKSQEYQFIFKKLFGSRYEGKCPDLLIDGMFYEHEGHISQNEKKAFRNMMNRGSAQASRIIIEDCNISNSFMLRSIAGKQKIGVKIEELWILNQNELKQIYKTEKQRISAAPEFNESVESLAQK